MKRLVVLMFFKALVSLFLMSSCASTVDLKTTYNATLDNYEYPFDVKKIIIKTQKQNIKMAYMYIKAPTENSKNKSVLLLHGKNFAGFYWKDTAEILVAKGYDVIIPDQIGFGKSDKPEYYNFNFTNLALNTKKLLEKLKISHVTVVGHSMGGMLATKFTKLYSKTVDKLILINPIGLEDYLLYVQPKDTNFFYNLEMNKTATKIRNYQKENYYAGQWNERYERLIEYSIGQLLHEDYARVAWNNALAYAPIFNEPIVDDFKSIQTPIVLILGTRDTTGPGRGFKKDGVSHSLGDYVSFAKNYKKIIKNGKVVILKGLGHMPQFEDFEAFKTVFLAEF